MTQRAGLLVLTLGFTATVQSVAIFTQVSARRQAVSVTLSLSTALGLDILTSMHSDIRGPNLRYPMFCCICNPDELTTSSAADSDICNWSCNSQLLPLSAQIIFYNPRSCATLLVGDHTTGKLNTWIRNSNLLYVTDQSTGGSTPLTIAAYTAYIFLLQRHSGECSKIYSNGFQPSSNRRLFGALVVQYMQETRKKLLHDLPSSPGGRGLNHRRPDYGG